MNEHKPKLTDDMIKANSRKKDMCGDSAYGFYIGADFARKFYEENYMKSESTEETNVESSKYKPFDLEECINKYDSMAIIVFDSNQIGPPLTEEGSIIATDSKVSPSCPLIFLSSDKREIYHASRDGRQIFSNSKREVLGKLVLPSKKKTLYWNLYRYSGKYYFNAPYSFDNVESAKERAKEEVEKHTGLEFIKTIPVEVEE